MANLAGGIETNTAQVFALDTDLKVGQFSFSDVNAANEEGTTALMWAAMTGYVRFLRVLVKHGAKLNARNADGKTALDIAIRDRQREIEDTLRNHGAKSGDELSARS